ncbi:hypothetical protein E2R52_04350 [Pantoea ananatis]|nr:hypothetical protein CG430_04740 [Pantoea ananatis]TDL59384.1 hypothetical protein E2R52_04350 [Pantoea ananatis]
MIFYLIQGLMKRATTVFFLFLSTVLISNSALAERAPLLGNLPASGQQLCGKTIKLQLVKTSDNIMLLGLKNRESSEMDLFMSSVAFTADNTYSRFVPVKFDQLSKHFIETHNPALEVVWGAAIDDKNVLSYKLALGSYTYSCGDIESWPNDTANQLYGESENGAEAEIK